MTEQTRPIPRATYRLQLSKAFTFTDVEAIAGYLGQLGISHAYLSPILQARSGSTHGYDTVDHRGINPELGTLDEFRQMAQSLREVGVSIILDIVPNHMGIGGYQNDLWLDVLEWGRQSPYADWFDINWDPVEPTLRDKVLVPFLGHSYGEALLEGELELRFDAEAGAFAIWAEGSHRLPLCPTTYGAIIDDAGEPLAEIAASFETLRSREQGPRLQDDLAAMADERPDVLAAIETAVACLNDEPGRVALARLISRQHWRPARYSVAADDINYRRFFIVADLAAIRIERDDVFDHVHALPFRLIAEGLVDGLRVDHVDGLYDPKAYCLKVRSLAPRPIYLVVEKILAPGELLRTDWDVEGTTGYEFSGALTRLLTDPAGETALTGIYESYTGQTDTLQQVERQAKLNIIDFEMTAELDALVARLRVIATADHGTADLTRNALRAALRATVAELQVYRTYVAQDDASHADHETIARAIARARDTTPALDPAVFAFLEAVMTTASGPGLDVAMRIQQYTGPVMAKGLEDTALYRFNRLIALSDVGEKPDQFTQSIASFHAFILGRLTEQKNGLLSTSSHDTKRGEDGRARIAALSGHAREWADCVSEWAITLRERGAPEIEPNDSYYFFQLLFGAWPSDFAPDQSLSRDALESFTERLTQAMVKSVREARLRTNWSVANEDYEDRIAGYVSVAVGDGQANSFLDSFRRFEGKVAWHGAQNSLIEAVLKLTMPGVPDIYQGAELWEQSMVDPDNRRPVDFSRRRDALDRIDEAGLLALRTTFRTGEIKLAVIARLLALRSRHPVLFTEGTYEPVAIAGTDANRVLAFARRGWGARMLVAVALGPWRGPVSAKLPEAYAGVWRNILLDREMTIVALDGSVFPEGLPFAVLVQEV